MTTYVLMTAARNEQAYLETTIESIVKQTLLPKKWLIINDGSTDNTEQIVTKYVEQYDFIELYSVAGDSRRNFGSKAKALGFAFERLKVLDFDFIGCLDADISLEPTYYEEILAKFDANPSLGLAGGVRCDLRNGEFHPVKFAPNSVGGPYQLFRRQCYEDVGGYQSLQFGGIDALAEISARMHGWEVQNFPEYVAYHYRATGSATKNMWTASFRAGIRDYSLGYHPLFQLLRGVEGLTKWPYFVYGSNLIFGYLWAAIRGYERYVSEELKAHLQSEQLARLKSLVIRWDAAKEAGG